MKEKNQEIELPKEAVEFTREQSFQYGKNFIDELKTKIKGIDVVSDKDDELHIKVPDGTKNGREIIHITPRARSFFGYYLPTPEGKQNGRVKTADEEKGITKTIEQKVNEIKKQIEEKRAKQKAIEDKARKEQG